MKMNSLSRRRLAARPRKAGGSPCGLCLPHSTRTQVSHQYVAGMKFNRASPSHGAKRKREKEFPSTAEVCAAATLLQRQPKLHTRTSGEPEYSGGGDVGLGQWLVTSVAGTREVSSLMQPGCPASNLSSLSR